MDLLQKLGEYARSFAQCNANASLVLTQLPGCIQSSIDIHLTWTVPLLVRKHNFNCPMQSLYINCQEIKNIQNTTVFRR